MSQICRSGYPIQINSHLVNERARGADAKARLEEEMELHRSDRNLAVYAGALLKSVAAASAMGR